MKEIQESTAQNWLASGTIWETEAGEENTYYVDEFGRAYFCKDYPTTPTVHPVRVLVWGPSGWGRPGVTTQYLTDPISSRLLVEVAHDSGGKDWHFAENLTRPERYTVKGI